MKEKNENFIVINGVRYSLSLPDISSVPFTICKLCDLRSFCDEIIEGPTLCHLFPDNDDKVFVKV